jgi:uncharacterized protein YndB with AHSA1/START domain
VRPDGLSLEITRLIRAPRERVFELFSNAGLLAQWWGPAGFSIPSIDFTPSVGASYRIEMQPPEGDAFHLIGAFREIDAPSGLSFSFEWQPPDPDDVVTVAQLSFAVIDDSTEVHLNQQPFKTEARRTLHRDGWNESFDRLAEVLARPG